MKQAGAGWGLLVVGFCALCGLLTIIDEIKIGSERWHVVLSDDGEPLVLVQDWWGLRDRGYRPLRYAGAGWQWQLESGKWESLPDHVLYMINGGQDDAGEDQR